VSAKSVLKPQGHGMGQHSTQQLFYWVMLIIIGFMASGCSSSSRSNIQPGFDNLSGTYRFTGLGFYAAADYPNPLIDLSDIETPSDISIVQTEDVIESIYLSSSGESVYNTLNLTNSQNGTTVWRDSVLTTTERVPVQGAPILPLPAKHYRGTRIVKDQAGDLYIIGFFREKGLFFTDYSEYELLLQRNN